MRGRKGGEINEEDEEALKLPELILTKNSRWQLRNRNRRCSFWWNLRQRKATPTVCFHQHKYQAGKFFAYFFDSPTPTEIVRGKDKQSH